MKITALPAVTYQETNIMSSKTVPECGGACQAKDKSWISLIALAFALFALIIGLITLDLVQKALPDLEPSLAQKICTDLVKRTIAEQQVDAYALYVGTFWQYCVEKPRPRFGFDDYDTDLIQLRPRPSVVDSFTAGAKMAS